jgi:drug/metabolite transporter (DMT)-like permease
MHIKRSSISAYADRPQHSNRHSGDDLPRAALWMVTSALLFAAMGEAVKVASAHLPNAMVVFFRNAFGLAVLLPWLPSLGTQGLRTAAWREHLVRALAGLAAMYCYFYAIGRIGLSEAIVLNYSLPLFVPLIARAWLGERVPARLWPALGVGFLGIVLILRPGIGVFRPAALLALAAAVLAALAQVGVRRLTRSEPILRIVFYFSLISAVVSALPLFFKAWTSPPRGLWLVLVAVGVLASLAQLLLTRAYSLAPATQVGPFIYSSVVFAGVFDWWLWGRVPDAAFVAGAVLVCAAGILALRSTAAPVAPPSVG